MATLVEYAIFLTLYADVHLIRLGCQLYVRLLWRQRQVENGIGESRQIVEAHEKGFYHCEDGGPPKAGNVISGKSRLPQYGKWYLGVPDAKLFADLQILFVC
jgi:hypothetical protein